MLAEVLLVVQDIIKGQGGTDRASVVACTVVVASVQCFMRIQEVHRRALGALHRETGRQRQLRKEMDGGLACSDELVVVRAVVLRTCDVLQRTGDVHTVEVGIILSRVLRIPDGCVGRGIDHRHQHAATVGTVTGNDTAAIGIV